MRITIIAMLVLLLFTACSSYTVEEAGKELFEATQLSMTKGDFSLYLAKEAEIKKKCKDKKISYSEALKVSQALIQVKLDELKEKTKDK